MQEIFDLSPEALERLMKRLTHHAWCKMRRLTWRGAYLSAGGCVPGGYEAYDFAVAAITKALDGTRSWKPTAYPTLEGFLRSAIDSDIHCLAVSADNRKSRRLAGSSTDDKTTPSCEKAGTEVDPRQLVIDDDWRDRFHRKAMPELDGDPFLQKLLECMEAGITAPQEIAELFDTTVEQVNNEKKRLRRALNKLDTRIKPVKKGAGS